MMRNVPRQQDQDRQQGRAEGQDRQQQPEQRNPFEGMRAGEDASTNPDLIPQPTQARANAMKERAYDEGGGEGEGGPGDPNVAPPVNRDVPLVTGNGVVGETLNCTMGNWEGEPSAYRYNWKMTRGSETPVNRSGQTNTYVVTADDAGGSVSCVVSAVNAGGSTDAPPSNAIQIAEAPTAAAQQTPNLTPKR